MIEMDLQKRILSFVRLGSRFPELLNTNLPDQTFSENGWFTRTEISRAFQSWSSLLTIENLTRWTRPYNLPDHPTTRNVLVITAGNIPLVGFHDFVSVLLCGHRFIGKLSSRDDLLLARLAEELIRMEPGFADLILLERSTIAPTAVIATGSDNSVRYFQSEYDHFPRIIRKNRSSAAILDGTETDEELFGLAADILEYYGLGCRSVSHLYLPADYSLERLAGIIAGYRKIEPCALQSDNLVYQRARMAILEMPVTDAVNVLLTASEGLHSAIGVVHYSYYKSSVLLLDQLKHQESDIQCLMGHQSINASLLPFGTAQKPELWDYADKVDTMEFLVNL